MANTAIPDHEITEYSESLDETKQKVKKLAEWVRQSKFSIASTGAGISTSVGIPDFRSPNGVWTLKAKGELHKLKGVRRGSVILPSPTHMALVELTNRKLLHCTISQNCDGLHIRSGMPIESLCEVHGNCEVEACADCGLCYHRNARVRSRRNGYLLTGRVCDGCGGKLRYTTVAFNQSMPDVCLAKAEAAAHKADLALVLGTSVRVYPAADLPLFLKNRKRSKQGKLVLVNLQKTPIDDHCDLRFFCKTDLVMELLMSELGLSIPKPQRVHVDLSPQQFSKQWAFRSAPDHTWCTPKNKQKLKANTKLVPGASDAAKLTAETDMGGYIEPINNCPHINEISVCPKDMTIMEATAIVQKGICQSCPANGKPVKENWMCLQCRKMCCGRYEKGHMLKHHDETAHPLVISIADLSVWCYACSGYCTHKALHPIYQTLYFAKFGSTPPILPGQNRRERNDNVEKISESFIPSSSS
eukprot:CAMPEP_0201544378 /NCGR_PEP_ID=MMETSP0173_2-20130828/975_1 /ASSEMBLY_ACC=CAM_ASM_000268 /TAXON_ID=218659 /ORGANISM="Vexillifera sp., Strain DIVA3 564/2" /LENGTH=471 /DNA_ID=CAMNT_0047952465 /DNA_START=23 /DNA_END=1438 /DNA_ORIENTATION=-